MSSFKDMNFTVELTSEVEYHENYKIVIQRILDSKGVRHIGINKNWRKKDTNEWFPGKGFWIPVEFAIEFLAKFALILGVDITINE